MILTRRQSKQTNQNNKDFHSNIIVTNFSTISLIIIYLI